MEDSKTLFCSSIFPRASEKISSKFTDNLGSPPHKFPSPGLHHFVGRCEYKRTFGRPQTDDSPLNIYRNLTTLIFKPLLSTFSSHYCQHFQATAVNIFKPLLSTVNCQHSDLYRRFNFRIIHIIRTSGQDLGTF